MFKKYFEKILQSLGLTEKAKARELTSEDWTAIEAAFEDEYDKTMTEIMVDSEKQAEIENERNIALQMLTAVTANSNDPETDEPGDEGTEETPEPQLNNQVSQVISMLKQTQDDNAELKQQIQKMAKEPIEDQPVATIGQTLSPHGLGHHTSTHLFGIEHPMFSLEARWNKVAQNPEYAASRIANDDDDAAFKAEVRSYGRSVAALYEKLFREKKLHEIKVGSFTNDIDDLSDAGLGDQFVEIRQKELIARILEIPSPFGLFPKVSYVQDRMLMTNAFFDELSQAYQEGQVFKGGMKLRPEMAYVDDAMFKTAFGPFKELERRYIGYLNTSGSDPMKWSMIEWQLLNMYKVLTNEQNERVIRGCYVAPETGKTGSYLNAGTGLLYTLQRYYHENKLNPFSDDAYNSYTAGTMLAAVDAFVEDVTQKLPENREITDYTLYLNRRHRSWWIAAIREKFGTHTDFGGTSDYANEVPDHGIKIKWVPVLGAKSTFMMIQEEGNLRAVENVPGEMLKVSMDTEMEKARAWSVWKEGFSAGFVGIAFEDLAKLEANDYAMQFVYINKPATVLEGKATTANAADNYWFLTSDNEASTALTNITGAKKGVVYIIETEGTTNATTIAKSGNFEKLTAAWTPKKKGDYIMVVLNSDNKFIELERRVNGTRTINQTTQPNIPGGR